MEDKGNIDIDECRIEMLTSRSQRIKHRICVFRVGVCIN